MATRESNVIMFPQPTDPERNEDVRIAEQFLAKIDLAPGVSFEAGAAGRVVSSRRKTSRAVIRRTINDGTTDMRESPDWIVFTMASWRPVRIEGHVSGLCRTNLVLLLRAPAATKLTSTRRHSVITSTKSRPAYDESWCEAGATLRDAARLAWAGAVSAYRPIHPAGGNRPRVLTEIADGRFRSSEK